VRTARRVAERNLWLARGFNLPATVVRVLSFPACIGQRFRTLFSERRRTSMRFKLAFQLAAIALIGLAATVMAQQQPPGQGGQGRGGGRGGPGGFMFGQTRIGLLSIPEIRKELELADEQVAEIEKVQQELRAKYGGRGGGGNDGKGRRGGNNNNEGALLTAPSQWYFVVA